MKKVLVVGMTHNPGGLESCIMNYIGRIDPNKIVFDFLCSTKTIAYSGEIRKRKGMIFHIDSKSKNPLTYRKQIRNFFKNNSNNYDAIWVNMNSITNLDYLKMAKKFGIKTRIIHSHNSASMYVGIRKMLHRINKVFIKKYATDFWACSEAAGKWFYNNKIIHSDSFKIIHNAIDTDKYKFSSVERSSIRNKYNIDDSSILIGHVGRFTPQKNHERVLSIFSKLLNENSNYMLMLVGDGELKEKIESMAVKAKIRNKIIFTGTVSDTHKYFSAMDYFVLPSLFEGLPVVSIEAQCSGLRTFASTNVPEEACATDLLSLIDLNNSDDEWANYITSTKPTDSKERQKYNKIVSKSTYNINTESKALETFFLER